jgi:hypothetical protein
LSDVFYSAGFVAYRLFSYNHPLPPGTPSKLFSGNLHQMSKNESWRTYAKLVETYGHFNQESSLCFQCRSRCDGLTGPVIYIHLRAFHKRFVILNSEKAAVDLLETRSSIYSDRPVVSLAFLVPAIALIDGGCTIGCLARGWLPDTVLYDAGPYLFNRTRVTDFSNRACDYPPRNLFHTSDGTHS